MSTTSTSVLHLSRRATALAALVLALFGSALFTAAASANFTLNSGKITLTAGATTGNPPAGSWVALPTDNPAATPPYFTNPSSTWVGTPDTYYTRIQPGTVGLTLGAAQPSGGITGSTTDTFNGLPWSLVSVSAPVLTFAGSHSDTVNTRQLTGGDLTGLRVRYNGTTYTVGTAFGPGPHRIQSLTGSIVRSTTGTGANAATISLTWQTDLTEPGGFGAFRAHFQLVGTYDHP
jgi:hypothetical protein